MGQMKRQKNGLPFMAFKNNSADSNHGKNMFSAKGDRTFSRWKGLVVDSVVGVFRTQNVSDHLPRSAGHLCLIRNLIL